MFLRTLGRAALASVALLIIRAQLQSNLPITAAFASPIPVALTPQDVDFQLRCRRAGVLVCQGFDLPGSLLPAKWPLPGIYPSGDQVYRGTFDPLVKASGNGSLKFEIPAYSPPNVAGYWRQPFGVEFGEATVFYVQFRQRLSLEMLTNKWGDTAWKQVIFHNAAATCGDMDLTTVDHYQDGLPIMYTQCGVRALYSNGGLEPYQVQQGDYNCWHGKYDPRSCFMYSANLWTTFYYRVSVGHWNLPDSKIDAWVATNGHPYKQWIEMPNFLLRNANPARGYDTLTLLPYMTDKDRTIDHPTAYTWYDELIISRTPIAAPLY